MRNEHTFVINGVGSMGKALAHQIVTTRVGDLVGLSDIDVDRAVACCRWLGLTHEVVAHADEADAVVAEGHVAVAGNGKILAGCGAGAIFFEASSAVGDAASVVMQAIDSGKNPVMMNSEADLAFGALFAQRAAENGVVYSSADGDQYGVLKRLADQISGWGFDLVMLGNIKGFLDRRANPTSIVPAADLRKLDYRMCTGFTDGTKLNIEMALIANVFGARPVRPGMLGPPARNVTEAAGLFDFPKLWDGGPPLVDYVLGAEPGGGVFVVGHSNDPYVRDMMKYYKLGDGPFYVFCRPYHLCHFEAVNAALEAIELRRPLMQVLRAEVEVVAYAKVALPTDARLDGVGGYSCYGLIERSTPDRGLPICIAGGARTKRSIAQDERIDMADVVFSDRSELELYEASRTLALAKPRSGPA